MTAEATILCGDAAEMLKTLPAASVQACITSPPYFGLRSYGAGAAEIGQEASPEQFIARLVGVFREVRRVLRDDGTLWIVIGDSYAGSGKGARKNKEGQKEVYVPDPDDSHCKMVKVPAGMKAKDRIGIPHMLAFALRADGWFWRDEIVWAKPNCMPSSQRDRCTSSHEFVFMFSKNPKYHYAIDAIKEPSSEVSAARLNRANNGTSAPGQRAHSGVAGPRKSDKQRGHSRTHTGFNDRWDKMGKAEQCSGMRTKRSVFAVPTLFCKMREDLPIETKQKLVAELLRRSII